MSWWRSTEVSAALLALTLMLLAPAAAAQEAPAGEPAQKGMAGGCEALKWPLDKERAAFEDAGIAQVASGSARGAFKEQAFALALAPVADVAFALPPAKKKNDGRGGMVAFAAPEKAGTYQVTLDSEGWIDLVQHGAALDAADHTGSRNCPGLRKSVRFAVGAAPVTLQISGAAGDSIKVAIRPAE
jgi:hypothetical protein